jgi:hypothetical protein
VIPSCRQQRPGTSPGSNPTMTLNPTSGPVGTTITITGSGFAANTPGNVISPWVSKLLTTTPDGTFSTTVTVPEKTPGGEYAFAADFPLGGPEEASATFIVGGTLTLSPTAGAMPTRFTVTGSGFAANAAGRVFMDGNRNNTWDPGESYQDLVTTATGTLPLVELAVCPAPFGPCYVYADFPLGSTKASAVFWVTSGITLEPTSGPVGTSVTVTGSGFAPNTFGTVTFPWIIGTLTTSPTGTFTATLPWWGPSVPGGDYTIEADIPSGGSIEASGTFTVTPRITLNPTHGDPDPVVWTTVKGTGFAANTPGRVFFDRDGDGVWDSTERNKTGTTTATGTFEISLDVFGSALPHQTYQIRADFPEGGPTEASATFTIP